LILSQNFLVDTYQRVGIKDNKNKNPLPALNEIAIFPKDSALLMNYTLVVDNNVLYRGRADGLIISTALGSTGYALSSGGPIAVSDPEILLLVPVNPLNKDHIPVVVPLNADVKLTNLKSRSPLEAIIDGQIRVRLEENVSIKQITALDLRHLEGVPPAAKYVFKLLVTEGEMTQKELIESTGLPNRTVRNALNILKEKGVISQRAHLRDARQSIYFVS
jgi:NAD+ kinase